MALGYVVDILGKVVRRRGIRMRLVAGTIGRARANAGVVRAAPEALAVLMIVAFGLAYFTLRHSYGERVAVLEDRLTSQQLRLAQYRAGSTEAAERAAAEIRRLTVLAADLRKRLDAEKSKAAAAAGRARDPQRLYEDDNPVASVRDPTVDLAGRTVTFPLVSSAVLLATDRPYRYRQWKLICGETQSYSALATGSAREFQYSHLICRIVGRG